MRIVDTSVLLPAQEDPPPPVDRAHAIERARAAACWVEAIGESYRSEGIPGTASGRSG